MLTLDGQCGTVFVNMFCFCRESKNMLPYIHS